MAQILKANSIQKHLEIKEIKDDVVILKNGALRAILMAASINFALKSTEEQDAIIFRYQDFLNSLDFPIQIVAASRKFDIDPYIQSLEQRKNQQEEELLRMQTSEYIDFVKGLTEMTNIMTESFYLVVPYSVSAVKKINFFDKILGKKQTSQEQEQDFQELKNNLWQRVEFVTTGLRNFGIRTVPLKTEELVELFYKLYNPTAKEEPELQKAKELRNQ
ncbi:MAG: TraC family protein [Patescibacteria group bacterium]